MNSNFRVMEQAEDATLPPLERLKFAAITATNADEFFMVRVGGLKQLQRAGVAQPDPAGMAPAAQLAAVSERMHELVARQHACLRKDIEPLLRKGGIRRLRLEELNSAQRRHVEAQFHNFLFPVLSPVAVSLEDEWPLLAGLGLALHVRLAPAADGAGPRHALVALPKNAARFLALPGESGFAYVLLEEVIRAQVGHLFPGVEVLDCAAFRITRNADMSVREDLAGDLLDQMREVLTERRESECVRLEIEKRASKESQAFLRAALQVDDADVYAVPGPLDRGVLPPGRPAGHRCAGSATGRRRRRAGGPADEPVFDTLKRGSLLLHHPYESYDPVLRLVQEAADDPNTLAIKQVLYRVSDNSPVVAALMRAAERGVHVTALVELKARFDEERNIDWADALARAGAQVIYGVKGYKTHAKICVVVRREPGGVVRYVHYGTGNYNEKSARIYSDISFMTCEEDYGADASVFFNTITGYSQLSKFRRVEAAPLGIRPRLRELIEAEAERCRQGEPAGIDAKMNSLADPELIEALYEASRAGVKIRLNVRGICCLRPGVKGLSENIEVRSIVDRHLEHARIFRFHNGGDPKLFIASADWMPRNLDRRIELMVPVEGREAADKLDWILKTCLADTAQSWRLRPDGSYERRRPDARHPLLRAQQAFQLRAESRAEAAGRQVPVFEPQRPAEPRKSP